MKYFFMIFWSLVIICGITFATLNPHTVTVNYYFNQAVVPLPILLVITLIMGVFLGFIVTLPSLIRSKRAAHRLKQRIKAVEAEVNNLRTIPIKETH